jgi:endonuclease/exonuclease/phosphatase (EEP) superfamily protein YafD
MIQALLIFFSTLFVVATILPMVKSDFWTFRSLEYPRVQKLFMGILFLLLLMIFRSQAAETFLWMLVPVSLCILYLVSKIFPYTFISPKEMKQVKSLLPENEIKILTANVLQDNTQYQKLISQVNALSPDLVLLVETDQKWAAGTAVLDQSFPYRLKMPLDNTYGLLFFSKLKMRNEKILFRVEDDIPSIEAEVQLPSGVWVRVFGLHPKPPVPDESLYSTAKDKELMKVALIVEKENKPCIVMGDLNDVAWSHITMLFRKVSGLLDPRRGRGFFSTFSALHWWFRFPLDYIFCSLHFGLVSMRRLPFIGSDHFAMFIHLQYQPGLHGKEDEPEADAIEEKEAVEKATEPIK